MRAKGPMVVGFLVVLTLMLGAAVACERKPTPVGMKIGERFHDIHTNKLQLKCEACHTKGSATYNDPLAQVVNLADNRACLSCHTEGGSQPFYGEEWNKAKVER